MKQLPLYKAIPKSPVEMVNPQSVTGQCVLCPLSQNVEKTICLGAEGDAQDRTGGVLIVGNYPLRIEDQNGRPFIAQSNIIARRLANEELNGEPVYFDNAVRCAPGNTAVNESNVSSCRAYLAQTIKEAKPRRIIALGRHAISSLLGRSLQPSQIRRSFGWIHVDGSPTPVFILNSPQDGISNKFQAKWFEADLRWALKAEEPRTPPWQGVLHLIESDADEELACDHLRDEAWFCFDTETSGVMHETDFKLMSLAACTSESETVYVWDRNALLHHSRSLKELLSDDGIKKIGHNLKYDAAAVRSGLNVSLKNHYGDTRLWRKLLNADADGSLDTMSELVGMGGIKAEVSGAIKDAVSRILSERRRSAKASSLLGMSEGDDILAAACARPDQPAKRYAYGLLSHSVLSRYNALDAVTTTRLGRQLGKQISSQKPLQFIWDDVVSGASQAIEQVEAWGIAASADNAKVFDHHLHVKQQILTQRFNQYPGFNPDSAQAVGRLLYQTLKLPILKKTDKEQPSTDAETLKLLKNKHPIIADLLEWRRLAKLRGQYAVGIQKHIRADGRVHTSLLLDGTVSGRLSSTEPNLQNIKRPDPKDPESKMCRDVFIAPPGYIFIEWDYSQLELRIATMLSGDPTMAEIWASGVDYHLKTAQMLAQTVWQIKPEEVTDAERSIAKTANFAVLYGMHAKTLSKRLGIPADLAERVLEAIKGKFKVFAKWAEAQITEARSTGYVVTYWKGQRARRRPLIDILSKDDYLRSHAENGAVNSPVQGCLPYNTRILTKLGLLKIGEAPTYGEVWTGGRFAQYEKLDRGKCSLASIELANGQVLECDTRHKVLTLGKDSYVFKSFDELSTDDSICLTVAKPLDFGEDFSEETAYWLGFIIGNGCTSHGTHHLNALSVCFGDRKDRYTKEACSERFIRWVDSQGFSCQKSRVYENKLSVSVENAEFKKQLIKYGLVWGATAKIKTTPAIIWKSNLAARKSYLLGLLDSDGSVGDYKANPNIHLSNKSLLSDAQILFRSVGCESTLRSLKDGAFRLDVIGFQANKELDYGKKRTKLCVNIATPDFVVKEFLYKLSSTNDLTSSDRTIVSRLRHGGTTSVYNIARIASVLNIELQLYSTKKLVKKTLHDSVETTWTLSVQDALHQFDSEGVVSKNTASEYCLASLVASVEWILSNNVPAKLVLPVHDSLLFEVREDAVELVESVIPGIMTGWPCAGPGGDVKLVVDKKYGTSWGSLQKAK